MMMLFKIIMMMMLVMMAVMMFSLHWCRWASTTHGTSPAVERRWLYLYLYITYFCINILYIYIHIISAGRRWPNIFSRTGNSIEVKRSRWETNLNIDTHALLQKGKWDGKSLKISHRQSWSKLHKKWRGCTTAATTITNSIQWQISSKPNLPFFDKTLLVPLLPGGGR